MYNLGQTYQTGALSYGNQFLSNPINEGEKNSAIYPIKSCRYAFNGMEQDKEVSGNGNSYTTQFRQYDPRLGRWKSLDPLAGIQPSSSPYFAFNNNPIFFVDPSGLIGGPAQSSAPNLGGSSDGNIKDVKRGGGRRNRARREKKHLENYAEREGIDDYSITFNKNGGAQMQYVEKDNTSVVTLPNGNVFIDTGEVFVAPDPNKVKPGMFGKLANLWKSFDNFMKTGFPDWAYSDLKGKSNPSQNQYHYKWLRGGLHYIIKGKDGAGPTLSSRDAIPTDGNTIPGAMGGATKGSKANNLKGIYKIKLDNKGLLQVRTFRGYTGLDIAKKYMNLAKGVKKGLGAGENIYNYSQIPNFNIPDNDTTPEPTVPPASYWGVINRDTVYIIREGRNRGDTTYTR
jgi:RHS repeat-associated protein